MDLVPLVFQFPLKILHIILRKIIFLYFHNFVQEASGFFFTICFLVLNITKFNDNISPIFVKQNEFHIRKLHFLNPSNRGRYVDSLYDSTYYQHSKKVIPYVQIYWVISPMILHAGAMKIEDSTLMPSVCR